MVAARFSYIFLSNASRIALPFIVLLLAAAGPVVAWGQNGFSRVPPTAPETAEATFEVLHGFRMELIAAEPLVASPVDLAYDEDGRAYVVEMRDYPFPEEKNAEPTVFEGTVRLLEDHDGDGKFDRSTIFADTLAWPTSVCCYRGGVFVAAAPDVWYFKDTNGDGKADVRRKVFTGFSRYNVQAIMNSLRWGLDNKIYGAASGNGGSVRHAERPDDPVLQLTRRDFRFDPVTEKIEAISGGERYGACFDDWGNRFLCNIRNPVQHVVLPLHYLARNPHLVVPSVIHDAAESGDQLRVYRASPPEPWREFRAQRWALEQANMPRSELIGAGYWTSSSGVCVYRGGAFPETFHGNVFIGEVAGNLIHRQILERDGATFKSRRADENTEFVRSRDNWFRPVNFVNAPDGTLTVLDMYRETIEHPWSIPDDIKAQLDLSSGKERGRLYRLRPPGFQSARPPNLSRASSAELVQHLASSHSWYRETAQRLLFERQDKSVVELLRAIARESMSQQAVLHALYILAGFNELDNEILLRHLNNASPPVLQHAIRLAEQPARQNKTIQAVFKHTLSMRTEPEVRIQLAFSVGETGDEATILGTLSVLPLRGSIDSWTRAAIVSSAGQCADGLVVRLLKDSGLSMAGAGEALSGRRSELIRDVAAVVGAGGDPEAVGHVLDVIARPLVRKRSDCEFAALAGLGEGLARRREKLGDHIERMPLSVAQELKNRLREVVAVAGNAAQPGVNRLPALELLGLLGWVDVRSVLLGAISPGEPGDVQRAALRTIGRFNEVEVASELINRWRRLTPPLREEAVNVLLSRPIWHEPLVRALEQGDVAVSQVSIPQRTRLGALRDAKLAERAKQVLAGVALGPRKEVIDKYQAALGQMGDSSRGQVVYRRECANCHKLRGEGHDVGPSLETIQHRSPQEILIHVLDPNREVSPNFLDYSVRLTDGRALTGMIAGETDAGLTLRRAQRQEDIVLRSEIEEIVSSGKSLMPEGLEQKVTLEEMSDLIAYLRMATSLK